MSDELMTDINQTLDELVKTAELIKAAKVDHHFDHELEALEKTHESLLARLMHRQSLLEMDKRKIALDSIRKEEIAKKAVDYAKKLNQKSARSRRARSKS